MPTLKINKGGTIYPIKLYGSEAETGIAGFPTFKVNYNGTPYYARMTTTLSGACGGDTPLRYKNSSGTTYQVTQKAEWTITVDGSAGQNICVNVNGNTYSGANTLWFAEGTGWNAWVEPDINHLAGNLNVTSGTLNGAVHLSVSPAITIPSGSTSYSADGKFTVPAHINVIHVAGTSSKTDWGGDFNNSYNIRVTPGKTYSITTHDSRYKRGSSYFTRELIAFNGLDISGTTYGARSMSISWSGTINTWGTDHDFR